MARLPQVLAELDRHPTGLPLVELAQRCGADPDELREDLLAQFSADVSPLVLPSVLRPATVTFFSPSDLDEEAGPEDATWVRPGMMSGLDELGVVWLTAAECAVLAYTAAAALDLDDGTLPPLERAHQVLLEALLGGAVSDQGPIVSTYAPALRRACYDRTAIRLHYDHPWDAGPSVHDVVPYRLMRQRRGWELDAGELTDPSAVRSYFVDVITKVEPLGEAPPWPDDLAVLLAQRSAETTAVLRVPQHFRWVVEEMVEASQVLHHHGDAVDLQVSVREPVEARLAAAVLAAGAGAAVLEPAALRDVPARIGRELRGRYPA